MAKPRLYIPFSAKLVCAMLWALAIGGLFFALVSAAPSSAQAATSNYKGIWVISQMRQQTLCIDRDSNHTLPSGDCRADADPDHPWTTIDTGPAAWNVTFCVGAGADLADGPADGWNSSTKSVTGAAITCNGSTTSKVTEKWSVPDNGWTKSPDPYTYWANVKTNSLMGSNSFSSNSHIIAPGLNWSRFGNDAINFSFRDQYIYSSNTAVDSTTAYAYNLTHTYSTDENMGVVQRYDSAKPSVMSRSGSYGVFIMDPVHTETNVAYSQIPVVWTVQGTVTTP